MSLLHYSLLPFFLLLFYDSSFSSIYLLCFSLFSASLPPSLYLIQLFFCLLFHPPFIPSSLPTLLCLFSPPSLLLPPHLSSFIGVWRNIRRNGDRDQPLVYQRLRQSAKACSHPLIRSFSLNIESIVMNEWPWLNEETHRNVLPRSFSSSAVLIQGGSHLAPAPAACSSDNLAYLWFTPHVATQHTPSIHTQTSSVWIRTPPSAYHTTDLFIRPFFPSFFPSFIHMHCLVLFPLIRLYIKSFTQGFAQWVVGGIVSVWVLVADNYLLSLVKDDVLTTSYIMTSRWMQPW